ncbi:MAG: biopolymer transporter ExbD [Candidatus Saccharibacteria bacterium]|nr:biopolymer transporter ExbD [Candidatus Saccharibacteria bacterium]
MRLPNEAEDRPPEINVVALIDVIFAILTFFIITSLSLSRTEGVPVNLPGSSSGQNQDQTKIVVSIDSQGILTLNRQPTTTADLSARIKSMIIKGQPTMVVINADEKSNHGTVVAAMDIIKQIPDVKMGIATKRK